MPSFHDLRVGETLYLAGQGQVQVTLVAKSGRRARLAIEADAAVAIRPLREGEGATLGEQEPGRAAAENPLFGWTEDPWRERSPRREADGHGASDPHARQSAARYREAG